MTGPRRSFCLIPFQVRKNELKEDCRERMYRVIGKIMEAKFKVPAQDKPLWSSISRSPQERAKAGHCNVVRNLVRYFSPDRGPYMDCQYGKDSCWLEDRKLSCATLPCDDRDAKLYVDLNSDHKPWINLTAVSAVLQADVDELEAYLRKPRDER